MTISPRGDEGARQRVRSEKNVVIERFIVTKNMVGDMINTACPYLTEKEKEFVDYEAHRGTFMCYDEGCERMLIDTKVFLDISEVRAVEEPENDVLQSCSAYDKPRCSYADLIKSALESSSTGKLTLSEIYGWIRQRHPFFRSGDLVWQNSIRHNLSLNKTFKKIPREPNSVGKGGYWAIDESFVPKKTIRVRKKRKRSNKQHGRNDENIEPRNDQSGSAGEECTKVSTVQNGSA